MFFAIADLDLSVQEEIRQILMPDNQVFEVIRDVLENVKSRLINKYDMTTIYSQVNENRNRELLMIIRKIVVYEIYALNPTRVLPDHVVDNKNEAMKWLRIVGLPSDNPECVIFPDLPLLSQTQSQTQRLGNGKQYSNSF